MRTTMKVLEWIATGVVVLVVALAVFVLVGPRFGWNTHPVLSGSMEPALPVGGVIVTRPVRLEDVKVGDIITFDVGGKRITHRVVEIVRQTGDPRPWFRTKGDANKAPDPNLVSSNTALMEKLAFQIPYAGYIASLARTKFGFLVLASVPAVVLIVMLIGDVGKGIGELREKRRANRASLGRQRFT